MTAATPTGAALNTAVVKVDMQKNKDASMGAAEQLLAFIDAEDPYDYKLSDVRALQIAAIQERFESVRDKMNILDQRASDSGVERITHIRDVVPLMFSDATYKSYPESFLSQGKWNALGSWLDALSTVRGAADLDYTGVTDIDGWLARLKENGRTVYVTSGTSGRCSIYQATEADRAIDLRGFSATWRWKCGVTPDQSRPVFALMPSRGSHRMLDTFVCMVRAFGRPDAIHYLTDKPLLVGDVNRMGQLSKAIAAGTASPGDIQAANEAAAAKQVEGREAMVRMGEAIVRHRDEPSFFVGTWGPLYALAQAAKGAGLVGGMPAGTLLQSGGGLKGTVVPPDYREQVVNILGVDPSHHLGMYGTSELNPFMPECSAGHFHVPPWHVPLILDKSGDNLLEPENGQVAGRVAFFDTTMNARWGAMVLGDYATLQLTPCACGRRGPSFLHEIVRYKDLPGGDDKVTCAGTIDTYVRGVVGRDQY